MNPKSSFPARRVFFPLLFSAAFALLASGCLRSAHAPEIQASHTAAAPAGGASHRAALESRVDALLGSYRDYSPRFLPGTSQYVFVSTRHGAPQLYRGELGRPGEAPVRLTSLATGLYTPVVSQDGSAIFFVAHNGDENTSIFRIQPDGSGLVRLTSGESMQYDSPLLARDVPGVLFYSARSLATSRVRIHAQPAVAGAAPRLIAELPGHGSLVDVDPSGKLGLFLVPISYAESELSVVDLTTGAARRLYPAERTRSIPVEYMLLEDEGHGIQKPANAVQFYVRSLEFLERALAAPR